MLCRKTLIRNTQDVCSIFLIFVALRLLWNLQRAYQHLKTWNCSCNHRAFSLRTSLHNYWECKLEQRRINRTNVILQTMLKISIEIMGQRKMMWRLEKIFFLLTAFSYLLNRWKVRGKQRKRTWWNCAKKWENFKRTSSLLRSTMCDGYCTFYSSRYIGVLIIPTCCWFGNLTYRHA